VNCVGGAFVLSLPIFSSSLSTAGSRREGSQLLFLASPPPLSFIFIFVYDDSWLEVSLALLTSFEVLSVVMYDLSHPIESATLVSLLLDPLS